MSHDEFIVLVHIVVFVWVSSTTGYAHLIGDVCVQEICVAQLEVQFSVLLMKHANQLVMWNL